MNKLSKEKKSQLILVGLLTAGVIAGLWFFLIAAQKDKLKEISTSIESTQGQMDKIQTVVTGAKEVESALKVSSARLDDIENGMPAGDLFSWIVRTVKTFNTAGYKVDMPQFGTPVVSQMSMLPGYPYNQTVVAVAGSSYYFEFGKFMAAFENHFPYMRIQNLTLEPGDGTTSEERERLKFHMEIVTLVKTNSP